jgi:phosphoribosylglycinamide formyltransferase-1
MMGGRALPTVVLISGRGSNMLALAARAAGIGIDIRAVLSDQPDAAGLERARALGLTAAAVARREFPDRAAHERALLERMAAAGAELVVLAGYMRILSPEFVRAYEGRMFNIHPSLLPAYPGLHTHERVLAAGDRVHGCTVHFVTPELDAGPAVIQARLPVLSGDTPESLSARVQTWEHRIYPEAVEWFAAGRLRFHEGAAWLDGERLAAPVQRGEFV